MKKSIVLSAYTGFPKSETGGPNRIIYELLNNHDYSKYKLRYISKDFDNCFDNKIDVKEKINDQIGLRKKISVFAFKQSKVFRKFVTNPLYLKYHYHNNDKLFNNIKKRIESDQPNVINAHDVQSMYYFLSCPVKKILTIHSKGRIKQDVQDYLHNLKLLKKEIEYFQKMETLSLEKSDIITFPSNSAKDIFFDGYENPYGDKIRIIYNGVDIKKINSIQPDQDILKRYNIQENYDFFLFNVADHIKTKNVHLIIEVVRYLKNVLNQNPLMINVGKGPETPFFEDLIRKYGLEKNIKLFPVIENSEIIKFMKKCDFYISLGQRVIFDMVILEAMASGAIVIAVNTGGNKEIIHNYKNGYLISEPSIPEILNVFQIAKKDVKYRAIETALKYSTDKMIAEYMNLYECN